MSSKEFDLDIEQMLDPGSTRGVPSKLNIKNKSKEAFNWALRFTKKIDLKTINKTQIAQVNAKNETIMDPISLEYKPYSDFLQLKECGSVLERDMLKELIDQLDFESLPKLWGFRSPIGVGDAPGCIYGELCNYNHSKDITNPDSSWPQKPGWLVCSIIQQSQKSKENDTFLTTHWIKAAYSKSKHGRDVYSYRTGTPAVSYFPVTEEGIMMFMMAKQCFAMRNYFSTTSDGLVKFGRIHKKTSITNTGGHGFPDGTWAQRLGGEMFNFGVTQYTTYQTVKKHCDKGFVKMYKKTRYVPEGAFKKELNYRNITDDPVWKHLQNFAWDIDELYLHPDGTQTTSRGAYSLPFSFAKEQTRKTFKTRIEDLRYVLQLHRAYGVGPKKKDWIENIKNSNITEQDFASAMLILTVPNIELYNYVKYKINPRGFNIVEPTSNWPTDSNKSTFKNQQLMMHLSNLINMRINGFHYFLVVKNKPIPTEYLKYYKEHLPIVWKPDPSLVLRKKTVFEDPEALLEFKFKLEETLYAKNFRLWGASHALYRRKLIRESKVLYEILYIYPQATLMHVSKPTINDAYTLSRGGRIFLDLGVLEHKIKNVTNSSILRLCKRWVKDQTLGANYINSLNSIIYYAPKPVAKNFSFEQYIYRGIQARELKELNFPHGKLISQPIPHSWSAQSAPGPLQFMGGGPCCMFRLKITEKTPFLMLTTGRLELATRNVLLNPNVDGKWKDGLSKVHQFEIILPSLLYKIVGEPITLFKHMDIDYLKHITPGQSTEWYTTNSKNGVKCYTLEIVSSLSFESDASIKHPHIIITKGKPNTHVSNCEGSTIITNISKKITNKHVMKALETNYALRSKKVRKRKKRTGDSKTRTYSTMTKTFTITSSPKLSKKRSSVATKRKKPKSV